MCNEYRQRRIWAGIYELRRTVAWVNTQLINVAWTRRHRWSDRFPINAWWRPLAGAAAGVAILATWSATTLFLRGSSDLDLFFWAAAQTAARGHPLLIYATHTPGIDPFANGPLGLVPLAGIAWLADAGNWADNIPLRTLAATAVFSPFVWLMATSGTVAIEHGRGEVQWRLATLSAFILAPTLWISVADFGHLEQPLELWLVLLGIGAWFSKRPVAAGIAVGLALLTRTTALLYVLPVAILTLERSQRRFGTRYLAATLVTVSAGIAPFVLADGTNVVHSLITYRSAQPIGGGSFWALPLGSGWQTVATRGDTYMAIALGLVVCCLICFRRKRPAPTWSNAAGLLTVAAACFPLVSRTAFPYYFLEPYVFAVIWWLAHRGSPLNWRLSAPALITADALLTKFGDVSPVTTTGIAGSVTCSVIMLSVIGLVALDLTSSHAAVRDEDDVNRNAPLNTPAVVAASQS